MARFRAVVTIQPPGLGGRPVSGHFSVRHQEGVLNRLFGEVDVAKEADQGGYRLAGLFPEGPIDCS